MSLIPVSLYLALSAAVAAPITDSVTDLAVPKFAILPSDWSVESGELTPKMSVKRPVVARMYADLIEGMYAGTVKTLGDKRS